MIKAIALAAVLLLPQTVVQRNVIFEDSNPRDIISHYTLYYGNTQGGPYPESLQIPMPAPAPPAGEDVQLSAELTLDPGVYYAVITCTLQPELGALESGYSNEASFDVPPATLINLRITVGVP